MGLKAKLRNLIENWRRSDEDSRHGAFALCAQQLEDVIGPPRENLPPITITSEEFHKDPGKYTEMTNKRTVRITSPGGKAILSMGGPVDLDE